jgi:signal transduction histidine kinase
MTVSFASQAAAKKLCLIIILILIPAVFFGGVYVRQALKDISVLKREIRGVELVELVFPAIETNSIAAVQDNLTAIQRLEASLGLAGDATFVAHVEKQSTALEGSKANEHSHNDGQLQGYIADVASISGVILDSDAESYHLANMLLINLPVVWNDAAKFEKLYLDPASQDSKRTKLSAVIGNIEGAFDRQIDSLNRALESSDRAQKYSMMSIAVERLKENTDALSENVTSAQPLHNHTRIVGLTSGMRRLSHAVVTPAFLILKSKLEERKVQLEKMLLLLLSAGLTTLMIATVLAARLISGTFKKLDAVEEAHEASEAMRRETDRVNNEVAALNRSLSDNLQKLKEAQQELLNKGKMEQLGQLTATVAHEIRNPLGSVRTSAFLIGRKVDTKKIGIDVQIDRINKGVDRCDDIITQLLDFSRTKQLVTQAAKFDNWLESAVREESESISLAVMIECHLGLGELDVHFDQARMRRALGNLMHNAAEAMVGKGDKMIPGATTHPLIRVETRRIHNNVDVMVTDNGPGMSSEVLEKVLEPLFTTKNFGTGLGLPAVEQIVKQHGGELLIRSMPGQGATFTLRFPINSSRSEAA